VPRRGSQYQAGVAGVILGATPSVTAGRRATRAVRPLCGVFPMKSKKDGHWSDAEATRSSLLVRLRNPDDAEAWNEFVTTYSVLFKWAALSARLGEHDADDVCQDVLLKLRRTAAAGFGYDRSKGGFRKWLWTVAKNAVIDQLRKRGRLQTGVDGLEESIAGRIVRGRAIEDGLRLPSEEEWERRAMTCAIRRALDKLKAAFPEETYRAFEMTSVRRRSVDGFIEYEISKRPMPKAVDEAAAALGWDQPRVYKARNKVWPRFREILKELYLEND
jgi:RNA polymerase sigma-70 factor, ECF subfamily